MQIKKQFSEKLNCNKHERIKKHFQDNDKRPVRDDIPYDKIIKLFTCPTINCTASSKCKSNTVKRLKSCSIVNTNKQSSKNHKKLHRKDWRTNRVHKGNLVHQSGTQGQLLLNFLSQCLSQETTWFA